MIFYSNFMFPLGNSLVSRYTPRCNIICEENLGLSLTPPSGGELKLLTSFNAENWAYNWLMMISSDNTPEYDEHYYMDLFNLKGLSNMYTTDEYFYLGFFPDGKFCNEGPKYIGLFELQHKKRTMNAKIIVENPHYIDEESCFYNFRDSLIFLTDQSRVFLNYKDLKMPSQIRFYYLWNLI